MTDGSKVTPPEDKVSAAKAVVNAVVNAVTAEVKDSCVICKAEYERAAGFTTVFKDEMYSLCIDCQNKLHNEWAGVLPLSK